MKGNEKYNNVEMLSNGKIVAYVLILFELKYAKKLKFEHCLSLCILFLNNWFRNSMRMT